MARRLCRAHLFGFTSTRTSGRSSAGSSNPSEGMESFLYIGTLLLVLPPIGNLMTGDVVTDPDKLSMLAEIPDGDRRGAPQRDVMHPHASRLGQCCLHECLA